MRLRRFTSAARPCAAAAAKTRGSTKPREPHPATVPLSNPRRAPRRAGRGAASGAAPAGPHLVEGKAQTSGTAPRVPSRSGLASRSRSRSPSYGVPARRARGPAPRTPTATPKPRTHALAQRSAHRVRVVARSAQPAAHLQASPAIAPGRSVAAPRTPRSRISSGTGHAQCRSMDASCGTGIASRSAARDKADRGRAWTP